MVRTVVLMLGLLTLTALLVACDNQPAASHNQPATNSGSANDPAANDVAAADGWDYLLKKHVHDDYFDYAALADTPSHGKLLDRFLKWQAEATPGDMKRAQAIAFYINAYNSCCVKAIVDHYPVHSPVDVPGGMDGFFKNLKFTVGGEELSVSQVEYDRLIANYKDMRAHFAVVCSDRGCLPLRAEAYTAANLDAALDDQARRFVADARQFRMDTSGPEPVLHISKIFMWYGPKFTQDPDRPAARPELYLLPYVDEATRTILESGNYDLKFNDWDWTLNEHLSQ